MIAVLEKGLRPKVPYHNFPVQLDSHSITLHAELNEKSTECKTIGEGLLLSIDDQRH